MSEQDQAPEVEVQPQATEENVAPAPESTAEQGSETKPEAKTFTQEELDRIVQKEKAKLERRHERERIAQQTREQIAQEQAQKPTASPDKPKESDFETYGEYLEALAEHKAREILRREREEEQQASAKQAQLTEAERQQARQTELIEKGEDKFDDFEQVIKADQNTYSRAAFLAMLESEIGAEMLYHLATNPDEGKRIASLPAFAQAKEIGKLEDKLASKPKPKPSNAPEPVKPLSGGSSPTVDLKSANMDDYIELRRKQGASWAR
jgi:hypothetical protein